MLELVLFFGAEFLGFTSVFNCCHWPCCGSSSLISERYHRFKQCKQGGHCNIHCICITGKEKQSKKIMTRPWNHEMDFLAIITFSFF